jgi:MFS family permease
MDFKETAGRTLYHLSPWQRASILVVCFLLHTVNWMDKQVFSVVLEPMKQDMGFTDTQAGLLQSGFFLSMALLAFPAAYLVDRWSRRKTLSLMAIVWSVFTYVTGMGRSFLGVPYSCIRNAFGE